MVGRIYVHVDLADVDTPAQILVVKGATLPALVQDSDMNESTGVWDLELATFDVDASEISNLVYTASGVSGGGGGAMLAPYYDASEAWLKDQIFQKDGVLYKCLTDIAVGTPLVVDTNVKVTNFAEETEALNQNLTINLADTSLPSSTTFNELIEMMAEKLYPKQISLKDLPQSSFEVVKGSAEYQPLRLYRNYQQPGTSTYRAFIQTSDYIDLTDFNALSVAYTGSSINTQGGASGISVFLINKGGTSVNAGNPTSGSSVSLANYSGEYKIRIETVSSTNNSVLTFTELLLAD
jgi:hypothetical protein